MQDKAEEEKLGILQQMLDNQDDDDEDDEEEDLSMPPILATTAKSVNLSFAQGRLKPLNIVLMVVGTRGDVQPFMGIGLRLKEFGHRVRIASHAVYRQAVLDAGLEFYPLGGDPKVLSEFVVKHGGILPGLDLSEVAEQRRQMRDILYSTWPACSEPDPDTPDKPFVADAIVANPPTYGHIHCAQKLHVPLHMVFTMPWTPTVAYPQPFIRLRQSHNANGSTSALQGTMNWFSYFAADDLTYLGIGDHIQEFRRSLGLKHTNTKAGSSHALYYCKIPFTYIWSPSLVPRPADWKSHCRVTGFIHLGPQASGAATYTPPDSLRDFLAAGDPPLFVGFGSLVMGNPEKLTERFVRATEEAGLRVIIQKGWGGLGAGLTDPPPHVHLLEACPHDWLFPRCCAVVHHGGAGTTAAGLMAGKPTFVVPFFGDQPFWGAACYRAGVGPKPCPITSLNTRRIVKALEMLRNPSSIKAAQALADAMAKEEGTDGTVEHIHHTLYGAILAGRSLKYYYKRLDEDSNQEGLADTEVLTSKTGKLSTAVRVSNFVRSLFGRKPSSVKDTLNPKSSGPAESDTASASSGLSGASGQSQPRRQRRSSLMSIGSEGGH